VGQDRGVTNVGYLCQKGGNDNFGGTVKTGCELKKRGQQSIAIWVGEGKDGTWVTVKNKKKRKRKKRRRYVRALD